jgi:hypothetical protein
MLPMMAEHQKQNMRDHLLAVQQIVDAVARDDLPAADKAASRLASSETMGRMCTHMGAAAPGFTEQALAFHRTADDIGAAARDGDARRTLSALSKTLAACTGCHARWKQRVVDETTYSSLPKIGAAPSVTH